MAIPAVLQQVNESGDLEGAPAHICPEVRLAEFGGSAAPMTHVYRWDRQGRKGHLCRVTARGKMNSIRVEFPDGYVMITSGNSIRRAA